MFSNVNKGDHLQRCLLPVLQVTEELHDNSSSVGVLKEKSGDLERKLKTETEEVKKRDAELKVGILDSMKPQIFF